MGEGWVTGLLEGPRGRRVCFELVQHSARRAPRPSGPALHGRAPAGGGGTFAERLVDAVAQLDLEGLADTRDARLFLSALADAVSWAYYWQEPDEVDTALQEPAVAGLLRPVAAALEACSAAAWWTSPVPLSDQWHLRWHQNTPVPDPSGPGGAAALLAAWRRKAVADEEQARRKHPVDPTAPWTGSWWSTPALSGLVSTTTTLPGSGMPVGLALLEDAFGAERAEVRCARVEPDVQVYELTGATASAELVGAYPLRVTSSRRHDWFRVTGWRGEWVVPDWQAVAEEWHGVHLTVAGYLSSAGRLLRPRPAGAEDPRTLLAGWDPGTTWWLSDVTALEAPTTWRSGPHAPLDWEPA